MPRSTNEESAEVVENKEESNRPPPNTTATPLMHRIMATWYRVPDKSLAKRRAPEEYTAANNSLPIGTRVRVSNPENGRSVIVRITERGVLDRHVKLDLCKEAAVELGVVEKGLAQLRMQVLPANEKGAPGESESIGTDN